MYNIGAAKKDITIFKENCGMLGYGMFHNVVKAVETQLFVRAFVIQKEDKKVAFINAEICFPTLALKDSVVEKLKEKTKGWSHDNIMLTAQHTHSAPGGFTHYFFYNITVSGFHQDIFDTYVKGITEAVIEAEKRIRPSAIFINKGLFDENTEVAFNRSLKPYNSNPEVEPKLKKHESHLALDREMKMLRFEGVDGQPIGCVNWFGVHTTSISNDNTRICSDNKGYAATYLENTLNELHPGKEQIISIFAQDTAADVTPNYIWDWKKRWTRGKFKDDFESARFNGKLQYEKALDIFDHAMAGKEVVGDLDYETIYVDLSQVNVDSEFAGGRINQRTAKACLGVSFLEGTREGPGMPKVFGLFSRLAYAVAKLYRKAIHSWFMPYEERMEMFHTFRSQHPKAAVLEMGTGHILGTKHIRKLIIPAFIDPVIKFFKHLDRTGFTKAKPWSPQILPLQIMIIGNLAIVALPCEMTTIAGQRLRNTVKKELRKKRRRRSDPFQLCQRLCWLHDNLRGIPLSKI